MRAMAHRGEHQGDLWFNDTTWHVEGQEWFKPVGTWRLMEAEVDTSESPPVAWLLYVQDGFRGANHWHKQTMNDGQGLKFVAGRTCKSRKVYNSLEFWTRWRHPEVDLAPPPQADEPMYVALPTPMFARARADELVRCDVQLIRPPSDS